MRALVYVRISHDPDGTRTGVERQRKDCMSLIEDRGWTAIDVLEDNDRGAYRGKKRPGWDEVIDRIHSGGVDVLVVWASDPIDPSPSRTRRPRRPFGEDRNPCRHSHVRRVRPQHTRRSGNCPHRRSHRPPRVGTQGGAFTGREPPQGIEGPTYGRPSSFRI